MSSSARMIEPTDLAVVHELQDCVSGCVALVLTHHELVENPRMAVVLICWRSVISIGAQLQKRDSRAPGRVDARTWALWFVSSTFSE